MFLSPAARRFLKDAIKAVAPFLWTSKAVERRHDFITRLKGVPSVVRMRFVNREKRFVLNLANRDKLVVFVADSPLRREPKFAYALKKAGWDVVLLHRDPLAITNLGDFCEIQHYSSPWEAVELAWKTKARLYHNFSAGCDDSMIRLLQNKPGRVIVDVYDIFRGIVDGMGTGGRYYGREEKQSFCLEHADGITCRDLQFQHLRKTVGVARNVPALSLPSYCWDLHTLPAPKRFGAGPHIVQVGGMEFETQGEYDTSFFRVVKALVGAGCHFHIFLGRGYTDMMKSDDPALLERFEKLFADYLELKSSTGQIHLHNFTPTGELIEKLAQFDFGFNMTNAATYDDVPWNTHDPAWMPYFATGRMFDYVDAGLGILADEIQTFNHHLFRGTGAYFNGTDIVRSGRIRENLASPPPRATVLEGRRKLSVERNIHRLVRFYKSLS